MKSRTMIVVVLALVCGGSAAVGVDQLRQRAVNSARVETVSVVIAGIDVPRGGLLTKDLLKVQNWPKPMVPPGALTDMEDALERSALVPLVRGELVLDAKLADKGAGRGLAAMIPSGMRAFTIRTPHVAAGVGGFILPGNRVDVLLTTTFGGRDDPTGGGATTTLLQNVEILAVDRMLDASDQTSIDPKKLNSVTLLVTPDHAAKLDLGMNKGILHLALRNSDDHNEADTRPATMKQLRFHQEPPQKGPSQVGLAVNNFIDFLAENASRESASVAKATEEEPEAAQPQTPEKPRHAQIRTLRGLHRSTIHIERGQ